MLSSDGLEASVAVLATVLNWNSKLLVQGSHQPGKSGKVREFGWTGKVREKSGNFGWNQGKRRKDEKLGNKKRTQNTIYNIDIYYIIRSEFL